MATLKNRYERLNQIRGRQEYDTSQINNGIPDIFCGINSPLGGIREDKKGNTYI